MSKIIQVVAREIIDSRGLPTIECSLTCQNGQTYTASVPSGTSLGTYEAIELRDNDPKRFCGYGALKAIELIHTVIADQLIGHDPDLTMVDKLLCKLDGTTNKKNLGANTTLAVSIATARAQAAQEGVELFELLNRTFIINAPSIPRCMFNIMNGGLHASNNIPIQEFMIIPKNNLPMIEVLNQVSTITYRLKMLLEKKGYATTVGLEGGFAPCIPGTGYTHIINVLDLLMQAVEHAGYNAELINIGLDAAASHFYDQMHKRYHLSNTTICSEELIHFYHQLAQRYPIIIIEDGLDASDTTGWQQLTKTFSSTSIKIVGDDLLATNPTRITQAEENHYATGTIIKPNQRGTLSEAAQAVATAQKFPAWITVASHRSGETCDASIADFAVGLATHFFKGGACMHGERTAKYNRLLTVEEKIQKL